MSTVLDIDAIAEHEASFFDFQSREGVRLTEREPIAAAYQGDEYRHAKELEVGQPVIDTHYGSPRVCQVIKRNKMSVRLRYEYPNGRVSEYGAPIHHLRRVE